MRVFHLHILISTVPYSGKLSREKIHGFRGLRAICKSFLYKMWGCAIPTYIYDWFQASFLCKIPPSYGSVKVFSLKSLPLYGMLVIAPCFHYPGAVYVGVCVLMLFLSQPQSEIEPVGISRDQKLLMSGGRVPKSISPIKGEHLSHMITLLRSHMFTEQGIKLKWIKERIARQEEY